MIIYPTTILTTNVFMSLSQRTLANDHEQSYSSVTTIKVIVKVWFLFFGISFQIISATISEILELEKIKICRWHDVEGHWKSLITYFAFPMGCKCPLADADDNDWLDGR